MVVAIFIANFGGIESVIALYISSILIDFRMNVSILNPNPKPPIPENKSITLTTITTYGHGIIRITYYLFN